MNLLACSIGIEQIKLMTIDQIYVCEKQRITCKKKKEIMLSLKEKDRRGKKDVRKKCTDKQRGRKEGKVWP